MSSTARASLTLFLITGAPPDESLELCHLVLYITKVLLELRFFLGSLLDSAESGMELAEVAGKR
jgi:hypothetical protein